MKMLFRWFGLDDVIPLKYIRQIPCVSGVATALYDVPIGEVWSNESIFRLKDVCDKAGLTLSVIESVPVHEDIKLGKKTRDKYIKNYIEILRRLKAAKVECICYNFMPVFDWLRSDLKKVLPDLSVASAFDKDYFLKKEPDVLSLPGWGDVVDKAYIDALREEYKGITHEQLFDNLVYFLRAVIPVCEELKLNMAIHPDDPPWDIYNLPRIIINESWLDRLFEAVPSRSNGLTFCTGSLGAGRTNDLVKMAKKYAKRIHFAHLRNVLWDKDGVGFVETAHPSECGSLDMAAIVRALVENGFDGFVRPDHGRTVFDENARPSYGLFDRAMGATYLVGLFEACKGGIK